MSGMKGSMKGKSANAEMQSVLHSAAKMGRNGDTILSHLTPGDVVIPVEVQTPEVKSALRKILGKKLSRYTAGSNADSINPQTGLSEFFDTDGSAAGDKGGMDNSSSADAATDNGGAAMEVGGGGYAGVTGGYARDASTPDGNSSAMIDAGFTGGYALDAAWGKENASPSFSENPFGWAIDKVEKSIDKSLNNPIATGINTALGFSPIGPFTAGFNAISSLLGGPTIGGMLTEAGRNAIAGNVTGVKESSNALAVDTTADIGGYGLSSEDTAISFNGRPTTPVLKSPQDSPAPAPNELFQTSPTGKKSIWL